MEGDEDDTHICLSCHQTIVGLDNYVKHRKVECPAKKTTTRNSSTKANDPQPTSLSPHQSLTDAILASRAAPTTINSTPTIENGFSDQGVIINNEQGTDDSSHIKDGASDSGATADNDTTNSTTEAADHAIFNEFFSSLELQSRTPGQQPKPTTQASDSSKLHDPCTFPVTDELDSFEQAKNLFESSKTLKIANLLNELDFSSDSEGFNEDFLNFSDMEEDVQAPSPSRPRLYGKWKPGMQHFPGKHSPGKGIRHKHSGKGEVHHKHAAKGDQASTSSMPGRHRGKLDIYKDIDSTDQGSSSSMPSSTKSDKPYKGHAGKLEAYKRHHKVDKLTAYKQSMWVDDEHNSGEDENEVGKLRPRTRRSTRHRPSSHGDGPAQILKKSPSKNLCPPPISKAVTTSDLLLSNTGGEYDKDCISDDSTVNSVKPSAPQQQQELRCIPCGRKFCKKASYERHLTSRLHKKRCLNISNQEETTKKAKKPTTMRCPICNKDFYNKFTFARHLVSPSHMRRIVPEGESERAYLNDGVKTLMLRLKPYQCRICSFYHDDKAAFLNHLQEKSHRDKSAELMGPLKCSKCKFSSRDTQVMYDHFDTSPAHRKVEKNDRPTMLREQRNKIPCKVCGKIIYSMMQLKIHMKVKHQEKKPQIKKKVRTKPSCTYCGAVCNSSFALAIHIRRLHTKERPYKCESCTVSFADKSTLNLHKKSQKHLHKLAELSENVLHKSKLNDEDSPHFRNIRSYKCDHCFYRTTDHAKLRPHYLQEHAMNIFNCEICGLTFLRERAYESHLNSAAHKKKSDFAEKEGHKTFSCDICNRKFYDERTFRVHEMFHRNARPDEKNVSFILEDIDEKFHDFVRNFKFDETQLFTRFQCPECKKRFQQEKLLVHFRLHSNKDPYQCLFCRKGMKDRMVLLQHLETHLEASKLKCQYCPKEFMLKKSLRRHILQKHREKAGLSDIPLFKCPHCSKEFCDKGVFNMHRLTHGEKTVKCPHPGCRLSFRLQSEMKLHYRTHTGERPYLCDVCGYGGKTRHQLNRHKRVHTQERNYHCEYCTYKASNSTNLRRHMRIHIGSKPYCCPYCPHRANCVENIRKHILKTKQHAGLSIYPCKDCDYKTNLAKDIKEHLIDAHGMDPATVAISSIYSGLYEKETDVSAIPEGGLVHPVRGPGGRLPKTTEKAKTKRSKSKSRAKKNQGNTDHAYVHNPDKQVIRELEPVLMETEIDAATVLTEVENPQNTTATVDTDGNVQYYIQTDQGSVPCFNIQMDYINCQDVIEETVITQEIIDQMIPISPE